MFLREVSYALRGNRHSDSKLPTGSQIFEKILRRKTVFNIANNTISFIQSKSAYECYFVLSREAEHSNLP